MTMFRVAAKLREADDLATLLAAFAREEGELRALMRAGGVALLIEGQAALGGTTPPLGAIRELAQRLAGAGELETFRTNELGREVPALADHQPIAAGVLATRLSRDRPEVLLWFRPEQSGEVTWAGDPTAGLVKSAEGFSLSPRASFEAWKEKLAGKSRPWLATDLVIADICSREVAHRLANIRARRAAEAKAEFLANMSHEIRTPMTAILGFVDILEHDVDLVNDPERVADALRTVRKNGRHLLTIINDVLDMSKLEAGKLAIEQVRFDPASVVEEVLSLMRVQAQGKGLRLDVTYAGPIPAVVTSDPTRLRQILLNLVGNALKFTERGAVTLRVAFGLVGERRMLEVSVTDKGIGLTPEQRESLLAFDAFTQADASTTRRFGGTGLGLRISNTLAKLLGGGISITSTYGEGSTFTVMVDPGDLEGVALVTDADRGVTRVDAVAKGPAAPHVAAVAPSLAGLRILLAEDGEDNQRLISFHLKKAGATVTLASNGLQALERVVEAAAAGTAFDLVLMDMQMPELDGYTATQRLRARGFAAPVIALTAHAMAEDRQKCLAAGCDDYESKPIDKGTLLAKCAAWRATGRTAPRA
jgi:light-regulated signal transduction histidine kinase (bacteriophytochrome)/CheY-like chemotaxis protein